MLRVVFDSTVLVSACLTQKQLSAQLLSQARQGVFSLYLSEAIVIET
jgi:predicted nucleic acid-binding protein